MMAYITRVTRSAMLEVLNQDFVRTARAKGATPAAVIWRMLSGKLHDPDHHGRRALSRILIGNSVV